MPVSILMPALSPTMTEGNVAKWLKKVGDDVKSGDIIAEVETDKATMEVESIDEGKLAKIIHSDGSENIAVNSMIGVISLEGETDNDVEKFLNEQNIQKTKVIENIKEEKNDNTSSSRLKKDNTEDGYKESNVKDETKENFISKLENAENGNKADKTLEIKQYDKTQFSSKTLISPLARRIAVLKNINVNEIKGSGPRGRIIKRDLNNFLDNNKELIRTKELGNSLSDSQSSKVIPLTNIRKTIASKLQNAKQTVPHFYLKTKVVAEEMVKARSIINSETISNGNKVSFNDIVIKAVAIALKVVPEMNATWNTDSIIQYNLADISVAVATKDGLFTPIIRSACTKTISKISLEMKDFILKARENQLMPEDYNGGSFSISNLGMYNVNEFSAIINPPQAGILAVGEIFDEIKLINDNVKAVKMMNLVLSVDHRVADGALAASFLNKIKFFLENPLGMLV